MIKPRIGGHPVHLMLVHFPAALFPMSVVCASLFYFYENTIAGHVSFYSMAAGSAMGWLAVLFGLWESFFIPFSKTKIVTLVFWHASLNSIVTILFTVWTITAWNQYPQMTKDSTLLLLIKWASIVLLLAGNYAGGKLVLKYHIGSENKETDNELSTF